MTTLETVALDQKRWQLTAGKLKMRNLNRYRLMAGLSLLGAILETIALQIRLSYPVASEIAGYAGAVALVLVLVVRTRGLRKEDVDAWVLALAAAHSLKNEMYCYRTSSGPYGKHLGQNPETTLLQRRDSILGKLRSIQKYAVEPDPGKVALLGPLDAEAYIEERVNGELKAFRFFTQDLPKIQSTWLRLENLLVIAGILLAVGLTVTHNQAYVAWVAVIVLVSLASGVSSKAERYSMLMIGHRVVIDRLTNILAQWRTNHATLDHLVEEVEAAVLTEAQAWVVALDNRLHYGSASSPAGDTSPELILHSPASRVGV